MVRYLKSYIDNNLKNMFCAFWQESVKIKPLTVFHRVRGPHPSLHLEVVQGVVHEAEAEKFWSRHPLQRERHDPPPALRLLRRQGPKLTPLPGENPSPQPGVDDQWSEQSPQPGGQPG